MDVQINRNWQYIATSLLGIYNTCGSGECTRTHVLMFKHINWFGVCSPKVRKGPICDGFGIGDRTSLVGCLFYFLKERICLSMTKRVYANIISMCCVYIRKLEKKIFMLILKDLVFCVLAFFVDVSTFSKTDDCFFFKYKCSLCISC